MKEYAEIFVEHKIYTYAVPESLRSSIKIGQAVLVPLRKKEIEGYIIRFVAKPEFPTRDIIEINTTTEYFDENLVKVAAWMAEHYKCYPETAFKAIMPK